MWPEMLCVFVGLAAAPGPVTAQPVAAAAAAEADKPVVAPLFPTADAAPVVPAGGYRPRSAGAARLVVPGTSTTIPGQIIGQRVVLQNGRIVTTQIVGPGQTTLGPLVRLPLAGQYGGIQLVENDNPRPTDRVYFGYNYYDRVGAAFNPGGNPLNLNRETVGFEKTFFNGDASLGLRVPFYQMNGDIRSREVGDLSV